MATGTRAFGDFCWINTLTPKPEEACGIVSPHGVPFHVIRYTR